MLHDVPRQSGDQKHWFRAKPVLDFIRGISSPSVGLSFGLGQRRIPE